MAEEIKRFYRSRTDRVLFGVSGGLGKYFRIDPVLFRLLFVLLTLANGAGILFYILLVLFTPEEPGRGKKENGLEGEVDELKEKIEEKAQELSHEVKPEEIRLSESRNVLGLLIILFGLFLLLRQFFPVYWIDSDAVWALLIIGVGVYIIFKK
jgi:phage shock protein C